MNKITERQKEILNMVVKEYIKGASPVSSRALKERFKLDVSPATIRLDFADLADAGFLRKGYVSGGRIPTDKGYRFYVDELVGEEDEVEEDVFYPMVKKVRDHLKLCHEISKNLAFLSSNLAVSHFSDSDLFWKEGWDRVIEEPEFRDVRYMRKFIKTVGDFEEKVNGFELTGGNKVAVYIGRESPFGVKEFSIVVGESRKPKKKSTFAIMGPKRMDFDKNISIMKCLIKSIERS